MTDENTNKLNFFKRVVTSIRDFDKYPIFAIEKTSTAIKYLSLILLIFSILIACTFTYQLNTFLSRVENFFDENIEDVHYENGELSVNSGEEVTFLTDSKVLPIIIINTGEAKEDETKSIDKIDEYESGILILRDKIIYSSEMLGQKVEYMYKDILNAYEITEFNTQDVINFATNFNNIRLYTSFIFVTAIYLFIMYFTSTLMDAILLAILGYVLARIIRIKLRFKACFNMGIYALTLPIILNFIYIVVNTFTGFYVRYFQWMYTTISYIYMLVAILIIKYDFINRQMELMKIVEEQEKVKRELEEQKKNKEEEKEPNDTNNPDEKKKEKKPKEKGVDDGGLAPQE